MKETLHFETHGHIAVITIDRPPHNALDSLTYSALSKAWMRVRDDDDIWVCVITGAGDRAFTVGVDLKQPLPQPVTIDNLWHTQAEAILNKGLEIWKPIIMAVNGLCVGGGMTMLMATDIRIAAEHARFMLPEVRRGILPGAGGTQRILRQLPYAIAMEMILLGEQLSAQDALKYGLVNRVVPLAELLPTAMDYAERFCQRAPLTVQATKELAVRSAGLGLNDGLRMETLVSFALRQTQDWTEGIAAFNEHRPAEFGAH